jgi:hypothetical protein
MKTRNYFQLVAFILAVMSLPLSSCKKDKIDKGNSDSASMEQLGTDENNMEGVMDDAIQDVEGVLSYHPSNLKSTGAIPCNATIDSLSVANDTITIRITYDGLNCNGTRNRTGQIEIRKRIGTHWGQAGATINYRYINYAVTRVSTGRTITFNGSKTLENVYGGFIWQVGNPLTPSVVQKVSGSMTITFDDGTTRSWNIARQRTYTGTQGHLLMSIDGFGTSGGYTNLVTWGTNRQGEEFFTKISQIVVHRQLCGWDPVEGVKIHVIPSDDKSATITFGFNNNNEPVTGDECPTRFRIDWQKGTHSGTKYIQLP